MPEPILSNTLAGEALASALRQLPASDVAEILVWIYSAQEELRRLDSSSSSVRYIGHWGSDDFQSAASYLADELPNAHRWLVAKFLSAATRTGKQREYTPANITGKVRENMSWIVTFVDSLGDAALRTDLRASDGYVTARLELDSDPRNLVGEIVSLKDKPTRKASLNALRSGTERARVRGYLSEVMSALVRSNFPEREDHLSQVTAQWAYRDQQEALQWLTELREPLLADTIIDANWEAIANKDPAAALAWTEKISAPVLRLRVQEELLALLSTEKSRLPEGLHIRLRSAIP